MGQKREKDSTVPCASAVEQKRYVHTTRCDSVNARLSKRTAYHSIISSTSLSNSRRSSWVVGDVVGSGDDLVGESPWRSNRSRYELVSRSEFRVRQEE